MGLLSRDSIKKITVKYLKEVGFIKIPWGSPDGRYDNGKRKWNREHQCWELFDDEYDFYYRINIYYFPKHFIGWVAPFSNKRENPAGHVLVEIESPSKVAYQLKQSVEYCGDIDAVIAIAQQEVDRLNEKWNKL